MNVLDYRCGSMMEKTVGQIERLVKLDLFLALTVVSDPRNYIVETGIRKTFTEKSFHRRIAFTMLSVTKFVEKVREMNSLVDSSSYPYFHHVCSTRDATLISRRLCQN